MEKFNPEDTINCVWCVDSETGDKVLMDRKTNKEIGRWKTTEPKHVSEPDEAELRVSTTRMYQLGGANNVLDCVITMQKVQLIILKKLNELLEEGKK